MVIKKKIWPKYFDRVVARKKKFELRLGDFAVSEGDTLVLDEWDPQTKQYTGRSVRTTVTYVLNTKDVTFWTPEEIAKHGLQVIQIEPK